MAQKYQVTPLSAGQQQFSESIYQLAANNGLGSPQAKYSDRKVGMGILVFGLIFLFLMPIYAVAELPQSFHSTPDSLLGALIVLAFFLLASLFFSAIGVYALLVNIYACSNGFIKVRGRQSKGVLQAVRWDHIQEVVLGWSQGRSFTYVRDTNGTRYIVRREIWLRAGSELAHREFASHSSALLATFHADQPVAFAQLRVSQSGIAIPKGKNYPARVLPLQEISQVKYDQYRNRRGYRRALLSFTLHSNAKIPPIDVLSAVDAALLLLFLHTLSQGQIRCEYAGRTF
jgi:hypothetical protein